MPKVINEKSLGFDGYAYSNGVYVLHKSAEVRKRLEPGVYNITQSQDGFVLLSPVSTTTDDLIELPTFISQEIIKEINKFWSPTTKERYHKYGMLYKRGILLYGKQGTGKTSIIATVMENHVKQGCIVFFCPDPALLQEVSKAVREIEGDRPFLVIYEELDKLLNYNEGGFLSILDGENQIENIVYIATTNYLNVIPPRIKNRPSRFATVIEVGVPDEKTRETFLSTKVKEDIDLGLWVKITDGMTIDQIKDLIISVYCIDVPLKDAVEKILNMGSIENEVHEEEDDERDSTSDPYDKYRRQNLFNSIFKN